MSLPCKAARGVKIASASTAQDIRYKLQTATSTHRGGRVAARSAKGRPQPPRADAVPNLRRPEAGGLLPQEDNNPVAFWHQLGRLWRPWHQRCQHRLRDASRQKEQCDGRPEALVCLTLSLQPLTRWDERSHMKDAAPFLEGSKELSHDCESGPFLS